MTILRLEGPVKEICDGIWSLEIGGIDVFAEITRLFGHRKEKVTIALGREVFQGDLDQWDGLQGYSEWTPADPPQLVVGDHDVWRRLSDLDGEIAILWVADEPINTLEPAP